MERALDAEELEQEEEEAFGELPLPNFKDVYL